MGLINPILVNSTNANDATAVGGSPGSCVYQVNATTNRVDVFIYYRAYGVAAAAIVNGSVLQPATSDAAVPAATTAYWTAATGDRNGTEAIIGANSNASVPFFGIGMATMTNAYYGYAQRSGLHTAVNTAGVTTAVSDLLTVSATDLRATQFKVIATASPTGTLIEEALVGLVGTVIVGAATSTSVVLLNPLSLV